VNPVSYAVDALRYALLGQAHFGIIKDSIALLITLVILMAFGIYRFQHIEA
jgi:ABC-type multidrug transport system permease subunit